MNTNVYIGNCTQCGNPATHLFQDIRKTYIKGQFELGKKHKFCDNCYNIFIQKHPHYNKNHWS